MRLTVGPLPSAVYWRRRAIVLVAILLPVIVLLYSCSGGDDPNTSTVGNDATPTPEATATLLTPETGAPPTGEAPVLPSPTAAPTSAAPSEQVPQNPAPQNPPTGDTCTDAEMSLIPVPARASAQPGVTIDIRLKIKNISTRTCTRDVGADMQEIYIKQGAEKVWSSDTCGAARGNDVQSFIPNHEMEFRVGWNGRTTSTCNGNLAGGDPPKPGEYQIIGRLDQKLSEPVKFTVTN
ncbi:hypothetical protein [Polymorphospora sp. NPDC050346]|uniref:hypothetical protein n=1 Tax=Polymorphospora sp. NPDC050346 TaxID=3155780 RepID=UPI0033CA4A87